MSRVQSSHALSGIISLKIIQHGSVSLCFLSGSQNMHHMDASHTHICTRTHTHPHPHLHPHTHIHTPTSTHTQTPTHTPTHTHTHSDTIPGQNTPASSCGPQLCAPGSTFLQDSRRVSLPVQSILSKNIRPEPGPNGAPRTP